MELDSAQNGGQTERAWSEDEDARPHTPDDTWHEDSPTEVKSEARPNETKPKGFFSYFKACCCVFTRIHYKICPLVTSEATR